MLNRRRFLQVGLGSAVLLGGTVLITQDRTPAAPQHRALSGPAANMIRALTPVLLDGTLPKDGPARQEAIQEVVDAFDRALAGLSPAVQKELQQLLTLLTFAPTRALVGGVWRNWSSASPEDVKGFLESWRTSRVDLLRAGYQALKQVMQAGWYGNARSWEAIGYSLPERAKALL